MKGETPRRAWARVRPRHKAVGYWVRRPEPWIAFSVLMGLLFVLMTVVVGDPVPAILGVVMAVGLCWFLWRHREGTRWSAEQWRLRRM